jgi:hypothetical protein
MLAGCGAQEPLTFPDAEWAEDPQILARADFPVFAPEGVPIEVGGWGGDDSGPLSSLSLRYDDKRREIDVESDTQGFGGEPADRLRDEGKVVTGVKTLRVDGVDRQAAFASSGDRWVATMKVEDVTITVDATGYSPGDVRLRQLTDPLQAVEKRPRYVPLRPNYDVLDPRRAEHLAEEAKPGIALLATKEPQASWFGGTPHLPDGVDWPEGDYGPLLFVGQLALADLPRRVWTGPATGTLHVFCAVDPENGSVDRPGACTVLHSRGSAQLRERAFPPDLHVDHRRFARQFVTSSVGLTVPDEDWEFAYRIREEQGWREPAGQVLGWPTWQNDPNMDYLAELGGGRAADYSLLLQTNFMGTELYVAMPTADVEAGRFDRVQATVEFD